MDLGYWLNLGKDYAEDHSDTEEALEAAKSNDGIWDKWVKLTDDEKEVAADNFADGMLSEQ
jgi:hypothetical protein